MLMCILELHKLPSTLKLAKVPPVQPLPSATTRAIRHSQSHISSRSQSNRAGPSRPAISRQSCTASASPYPMPIAGPSRNMIHTRGPTAIQRHYPAAGPSRSLTAQTQTHRLLHLPPSNAPSASILFDAASYQNIVDSLLEKVAVLD